MRLKQRYNGDIAAVHDINLPKNFSSYTFLIHKDLRE